MTFFYKIPRTTTESTSLLRKVVTFVITAALIVLALMFSALLFAVVLTAGAVAGCYLWWKTRDLRKQMREHPPYGVAIEDVLIEGRVIEGEVIKGEVIEGEVIEAEVIREVDFRDGNKR